MTGEKQPTYDDAQLILRLYELRREEKMREARDWFMREFFPDNIEDFLAILAPGNPHNAHFRMVATYWDMVASFAVRGPLNADLLLESAGELLLVWAKVAPFVAHVRETLSLPEYLRNLEEIIKLVDWAPRRIEWLNERFRIYREHLGKSSEVED
ncbi:MAG TPA: hypothetical protein VF762_03850 [Blastocatellia bacterium]|jgi:hypothetical protein